MDLLQFRCIGVIIEDSYVVHRDRRTYMDQPAEKWSSLDETAKYIGVTKETIRNWIEKGVIPAYKVGKQWKFRFSEIDEWIKSGESAKIVE